MDTNASEPAAGEVDAAAPPPPLPDSVTEIVHDGVTYYLVGTAHVSQRSVEDVRTVIDRVKPDVVCVELDKVRYEALTKDSAFRDLDVIKVVREGRTLYLLAHLALASYQRKIGASLGVKPGAELLAAVDAANERKIPVELIDRDINITLKRTWKNLGWWKRSTLMMSLVIGFGDDEEAEPVTEESVEGLKKPEDLSEMLTELGRAVPQIKGPLIDERDRYMASKSVEAGAGKRRVVVVVGAAHVPGMKSGFGKPVDRAAIETVPPPSIAWKVIKYLVPLLLIAGLILLWRHSDDTASLLEMMLAWMIPTSIGAGALTLLVGGSPFSVLTALVVAPLASFHPLIRTGPLVGLVEAWRRKPSVLDCEQLPEAVQTFRGFWRNQVTRIFLTAIAAGIGKWIGFWVGVSVVASRL